MTKKEALFYFIDNAPYALWAPSTTRFCGAPDMKGFRAMAADHIRHTEISPRWLTREA